MKYDVFSLTKTSAWLLAFVWVGMTISCTTEDPMEDEDPIASFQFEIDEADFLKVTFSNFSQNATSYSWTFGDGGTSTDENPVHTYDAAGTYEVELTATNAAGVSVSRKENVTLTDPDAELTKLAGLESKTWILQREGVTLGIGPSANNNSYWSFGGVTPHGDRPCILDDEYTFTRAGGFEFNSNGTIFLDGPGNGGFNNTTPDQCNEEATANFTSSGGNDMSAYKNGGDYSYTFEGGVLTLTGAGVYIGLPNKTNNGDIGGSSDPQNMLTYEVIKLVDRDDVDSLHLALAVNGGESYWNFYLVHYDNESLKPAIPAAGPKANFTFDYTEGEKTVTFTNTSTDATTYAWDFGDGNTSTETSPVHTYAADGIYNVKLTATGENGVNEIIKAVQLNVQPITTFLIDHETAVTWEAFGGSGVEIVDNPDASGINTSAKVLKVTHGSETWAGIVVGLTGPIDFTGKTKVTAKIWAPASCTVKYKLEAPGGSPAQEIDLSVTTAEEWVKIEWDLSTSIGDTPVQSNVYSRVVLFPGWNTTTPDVYYIDDVTVE